MKTQKIVLIGILAAVICVLAPLSLPMGAVPISLATLAIYIVSCTVNTKISVCAVIIYILLGAAGLPVFSSFQGGFQIISGITGGYIIGYIPCALIIGFLVKRFEGTKWIYPISMVAGTSACYLTGTLWYIYHTNSSFLSALAVCVVPFFIGDIIKITAACAVGITLRKRLKRFTKSI